MCSERRGGGGVRGGGLAGLGKGGEEESKVRGDIKILLLKLVTFCRKLSNDVDGVL